VTTKTDNKTLSFAVIQMTGAGIALAVVYSLWGFEPAVMVGLSFIAGMQWAQFYWISEGGKQ